jgi:glycyl-tRNA synthetase
MAQQRYVTQPDMTKIVSLAKRRGFIFPSSEIYGGLGSTWDYGPLGVELKRNVKDAWWRTMVHDRDDVVGLDAAILMHPRVWEASGHVEGFTDPLVECNVCNHRFRADHLENPEGPCPDCGAKDSFTEPRMFNLMFETYVGPVTDSASKVWLRPETAQGIFVNFDNVLTSTRMKLPFGIAQIGKSFRNEITPGNFVFRTREFEQMEMEFFVKPGEDDQWHEYWVKTRHDWYVGLGIRPDSLRLRPHDEDELSHYAKATSDVEYLFPWGWGELEGIANRTDFDLRRHSEFSDPDYAEREAKHLMYFDQEENSHYFPYVIEPSGGADRATLAFLVDAYDEEPSKDEGKDDTRVVLRFHPDIAPAKVAILPLSRNEKLVPAAREVYNAVRKTMTCMYDDAQSIGRRYRRQDEIGTPLCVTVDFQTVEEDQAVTIRNRDTMEQVRVPIADLVPALQGQLRDMGSTRA